MKRIISSILLLSFIATFAISQDYAVDKGAFILSGTGGFMSQGGDLYEVGEDRLSTFSLTSVANYFVIPNVFIGAGITYTRVSQGEDSMSTIGIGPTVGYAFGKAEGKSYPYIAGGFHFHSIGANDETISGTNILVSAGIILSIKKHIGLVLEIGYNFQNLKHEDWAESESGNAFVVSIGIAGLIF